MILISNNQRDEAVRYLDMLCEHLDGAKSNRDYNARRLAARLRRALSGRRVLTEDELNALKKISRPDR